MNGDQIFQDFDRCSVEPVTLNEYIGEYEQMWKWMVKFLSKFQGRGIKIDRINSIRFANSLVLFNIFLPLLAKWRHHELSFSLRWTFISYP